MQQAPRIAGSYTLISFKLTKYASGQSENVQRRIQAGGTGSEYELKSIVYSWSITESIKSAAVRGTASIYDAVGAFYKIPLTGQEILEITYRDTKGVELTEKFFVYAITDLMPSKQKDDGLLEYKIHFVSFGKFWSDRYKIKRCIANGSGLTRRYIPISSPPPNPEPGIVQVLFDDYYASPGGTLKQLTATRTDGPAKIVIPNMKPEDAMHMLSRKSFSSEYPSQQFRFFENRAGYYFVNMEDWFLFGSKEYEPQLFYYNTGPGDNSPEGELAKLQNIISLDYGNFVNTIDMMNSGAYAREYVGLNIFDRTPEFTPYNYNDEIQNYVYPDENLPMKTQHTDELINDHLNKLNTTYGLTDFNESDNPARHYPAIFNHRVGSMYHYNNNTISAKIYGTKEVFAGSIITLTELPRFGADDTENEGDRKRIGNYLVESVTNEFIENTYTQSLTLTKGGLLDTGDIL